MPKDINWSEILRDHLEGVARELSGAPDSCPDELAAKIDAVVAKVKAKHETPAHASSRSANWPERQDTIEGFHLVVFKCDTIPGGWLLLEKKCRKQYGTPAKLDFDEENFVWKRAAQQKGCPRWAYILPGSNKIHLYFTNEVDAIDCKLRFG